MISIGKTGSLARVRAIGNDGYQLHLELRNGQIAIADGQTPFDFKIGSIVLISGDEKNQTIEVVPDELWAEESWVGIVRLKLPDVTVVDEGSGRWKILPTNNDINYSSGNTIEAKNSSGIIRVLAKDPLKYIDLPTIDETVIAKFRIEPKSITDTFDDFGGLDDVVKRARELIEVPIKHKKELENIKTRPIKGVLFTGEPGTGKTMLAKIIANSVDATFYEISGPEIFSKWYGQSEELLRELFKDAEQQNQAIIFFDEIDSVAGQRTDESHEASRRVVAQLLTLMDGFTKNNVLVIAASNRPQDIDIALRRPGRFDWVINFHLPTCKDRELILKASGRRLSTSSTLPHEWIARNTDAWTAAELAAIWLEAGLLAAKDCRSIIEEEDYIGGFERVSLQRKETKLSAKGNQK